MVPIPTTGAIAVESVDGVNVLRLAGDIDAELIGAYEAETSMADASVIGAIDLSDVRHFSSSGIAFVLRQTRRAREQGDVPVLRGASTPARRVLALAGVADLFGSRT